MSRRTQFHADGSRSLRRAALLLAFALAAAFAPCETPRLAPAFPASFDPLATVAASLAGEWEFALEEALPAALRGADGAAIAMAAWPNAGALAVPGCFTAQLPGRREFVGWGWYRATIAADAVPAALSARFLHFDGVARLCDVYVNGRLAASNKFSYLGFAVELPADPPDGVWTVALRVGNPVLDDAIPDNRWNGWWNHAGIFREVRLAASARPDILERFPAQPYSLRTIPRDANVGPSAGWNVFVLPNIAEPGWTASAELREVGGAGRSWRVEAEGDAAGAMLALPGDVAAWSPDRPALHELRVELSKSGELVHRLATRVGLRDLRARGARVFLNGEPLRLLGQSYHEQDRRGGYTISDETLRADLLDMKAIGCNFLRTAHYPGDPRLLDLCDELGLALWEEIPAWKTRAKRLADDAIFEGWAKPYLAGMIERDRNRPSVLFWSVGNEFDSRDRRVRGYVERATRFVRSLDSTRFATFASDRRLEDISLDLVDVIGVNEYYGWYYGEPSDLGPVLDQLRARYPSKPILVTEFGAETVLGARSWPADARRDYSEPHQARFVQEHLRQILDPARAAWSLGACAWLYKDFDDPHRLDKHHPREWLKVNMKGLVTRDGAPKMARAAFAESAREFGFLPPANGEGEADQAAVAANQPE
jgi:beta-glucuronidase